MDYAQDAPPLYRPQTDRMASRLFPLFLIASSVCAEPASDKELSITTEYWLGYQVRYNKWNTIWVNIKTGGTACKGTLKYKGRNGNRLVAKSIDVRAGSQMLVPFYVWLYSSNDRLEFRSADGAIQDITPPALRTEIQEHTTTVAILGRLQKPFMNDPLQWLRFVHLSRDELPGDIRAYDAMDVLIWVDPDFDKLTPSRTRALREWVKFGGELVVIPGEGWKRIASSPIAELMPALPAESYERTDWQVLSSLSGKEPLGGQGQCWRLGDDVDTMWASSDAGLGLVTILGFDPGSRLFHNWKGIDYVWDRVLGCQELQTKTQAGTKLSKTTQFWNSLQQFSRVRAVRFGSILLFLLIYTLVIGPGDYFLLKKVRRSHLTWVTFPLIVAGTIGYTCWWAITAKGGQFRGNTVTLIDALPDGKARFHEYSLLFSPRAGRLKMSGPSQCWIGPGPEYMQNHYDDSSRLSFDEDTSVLDLPVQQWSRKRVQLHFSDEFSGELVLRYVETTNLKKVAQLVNGTAMHFSDGHLLMNNKIFQVPEMTAGDEVEILPEISRSRRSMSVYAFQVMDYYRFGPAAPPPNPGSTGRMSTDIRNHPLLLRNPKTGSRFIRPPRVHSINHADLIPGRNNRKRVIFVGKTKLKARLKIEAVTPERERQDAYVRAIVRVEEQP